MKPRPGGTSRRRMAVMIHGGLQVIVAEPRKAATKVSRIMVTTC